MTPRLGDRVRFTRRAGRFYFWDEIAPASADPDFPEQDGPRIATKDGIPDEEQTKLLAELSIDDEAWTLDGGNLNNGTCRIHEWDESGEGVLIGKTSRTVFERIVAGDGVTFLGMSPGKTTQFHEVRASLRGRRMLVPIDALEVIS